MYPDPSHNSPHGLPHEEPPFHPSLNYKAYISLKAEPVHPYHCGYIK